MSTFWTKDNTTVPISGIDDFLCFTSTGSNRTYTQANMPSLQIDGEMVLSPEAIASLKKQLDYDDVIVKCAWCGQWGARKTECRHCGQAIG